ncbi:MAG: monovalent cation/H(+) antiporter subunit G [Planctomycetaceae bacterium]|nr:monovalent cation/H(+) antiporter subunit G [Planctomycetaceae bacterium]
MREFAVVILLLTGATFTLLAAVGLLRLPDLLTRMQAATKTGTLGVGCTVLAVAVFFDQTGITTRALMIVVFLFMTAPIAAHMIARAAYFAGAELWEGTVHDDLRDRYDSETNTLQSGAS